MVRKTFVGVRPMIHRTGRLRPRLHRAKFRGEGPKPVGWQDPSIVNQDKAIRREVGFAGVFSVGSVQPPVSEAITPHGTVGVAVKKRRWGKVGRALRSGPVRIYTEEEIAMEEILRKKKAVDEYIKARPGEKITAKDVAAALNLGTSHSSRAIITNTLRKLCQKISEDGGVTIWQYDPERAAKAAVSSGRRSSRRRAVPEPRTSTAKLMRNAVKCPHCGNVFEVEV